MSDEKEEEKGRNSQQVTNIFVLLPNQGTFEKTQNLILPRNAHRKHCPLERKIPIFLPDEMVSALVNNKLRNRQMSVYGLRKEKKDAFISL